MFSPIQLYWRDPEQDYDLSCMLKCHFDGRLLYSPNHMMQFLLAHTHSYDVYHLPGRAGQ